MKKKIIITLLIIAIILLNILIPQNVQAAKEELSIYSDDITYEYISEEEGELMGFGLFIPSNADKFEKIPMIVHLHGWDAFGETPEGLQWSHFPSLLNGRLLELNEQNFSAYVLCPCLNTPDGYWHNAVDEVRDLVDAVIEEYNVDTENIVIAGESRGGTGALDLANSMSDYFSKCVAISAFGTHTGYNTSKDTLCFYTSFAPAKGEREAASTLRSVFGEERVIDIAMGHGAVGYYAFGDDSDYLAQYGIGEER